MYFGIFFRNSVAIHAATRYLDVVLRIFVLSVSPPIKIGVTDTIRIVCKKSDGGIIF